VNCIFSATGFSYELDVIIIQQRIPDSPSNDFVIVYG
jgi:hypothetical protein